MKNENIRTKIVHYLKENFDTIGIQPIRIDIDNCNILITDKVRSFHVRVFNKDTYNVEYLEVDKDALKALEDPFITYCKSLDDDMFIKACELFKAATGHLNDSLNATERKLFRVCVQFIALQEYNANSKRIKELEKENKKLHSYLDI